MKTRWKDLTSNTVDQRRIASRTLGAENVEPLVHALALRRIWNTGRGYLDVYKMHHDGRGPSDGV
jgi:hypothetical protein